MNSCPACQGYAGLKPCSNYCINVMKGCLVFHIEMQQKWDDFAGKKSYIITQPFESRRSRVLTHLFVVL